MFTTRRKGIIAILGTVFAAALIACAISWAPSASRTAPVYAAEGDLQVTQIVDSNDSSITYETVEDAVAADIKFIIDTDEPGVYNGYTSLYNAMLYDFKANDTLILLQDCETNWLTLPNGSVIDLNGHDLTYTGTTTITFSGSGKTATITDNSVSGSERGGTLNITGERDGSQSVFEIAGAKLNVSNINIQSTGCVFYPRGNTAELNITNCAITTTGVFCVATNAGDQAYYGVTINISGSSLTAAAENDDDCAIMMNVSGSLNIENSVITGDRQGLFVRAGDVTVVNSEIVVTGDWAAREENDENAYHDGDWQSGNEAPSAAIVAGNRNGTYFADANVTIENSTITAPKEVVAIYVDATSAPQGTAETSYSSDVSISGAETSVTGSIVNNATDGDGKSIEIAVTGGTFSEAFDSSYIAEGSVLYTTDGDSFTVGTDDEAIAADIKIIIDGVGYTKIPESVVATVGAEGKVPAGYESLQDAITAAADGDTITLVRDITTTSYTVINDKDITIDLADFTITATGCDETYSSLLFIQGGSNVTIENGSLVGDFETSGINFDVIYLNSSNLTLNDVNISAAHDYMDGILFYGGMTNSDAVTAYNNKDFSNYYTLNVNNSTVVGYWYAIDGNAAGTHNGTIININNSTVTDATDVIGEPSGTAIFHPHFGILNVSGDDTLISGATGIEMRAGELNISGGNIVGNNEFMTSASGNGNSVFGAAVAVSQHTTNLLISVNVTGGTLETVGNAVYALYENDLINDGDVDDITISVTGGTFNGEVYSEDVVDFISGGQFKAEPDETYLAEGFSGFSEYNGMFVPVTSTTEGTMLEEIEQIRQEIDEAIAAINGALAGGDATTLAESMTKLIDRMNELEAMIGELDESMVTEADLAALRGSVTAAYTAAVSQVRAQLSAQIDDLREAIAGMGDVSAELEELRAAYEAADELLSADIADVSAELEAAISELESAYGEADDAIWNAIYALRDTDSGMTTALWVIGVIAVLALCAGVAGVAFAIVRTKRS